MIQGRQIEERSMTWDALTALATAFTGCVILVTALIGAYQLQQVREQRRDTAAIELMRSLQDTTFARAFLTIMSQPEKTLMANASVEVNEAALILAFRFETLGLLVYRRTISFDIVEDLVGGAAVTTWHRLKERTLSQREEQHWPMYCEWFQWLAEQLEKRDRLGQTPAYLRANDWNPQTPSRPIQ